VHQVSREIGFDVAPEGSAMDRCDYVGFI